MRATYFHMDRERERVSYGHIGSGVYHTEVGLDKQHDSNQTLVLLKGQSNRSSTCLNRTFLEKTWRCASLAQSNVEKIKVFGLATLAVSLFAL